MCFVPARRLWKSSLVDSAPRLHPLELLVVVLFRFMPFLQKSVLTTLGFIHRVFQVGAEVLVCIPQNVQEWKVLAIRILIIDDHPVVQEGLTELLKGTPHYRVVAMASDGDEALAKARRKKPDLILLDIGLPGKSGFELLKQLHREMPRTKVLVLSMYSERQFAVRCLKAGAMGYLTKRSAPKEILTAIEKVTAGGKYISAILAEHLAAGIGFDAMCAPHERLSDREFQALCFMGQGMTVAQIAATLSISVSTVNKYRAQLLRKMNLDTTAQLIRYALTNNLAYPSE